MFLVEGRLQLQRASLTEWLGFARNLAPGLQVALDDVTRGSLDFSLDGKGLRVPHIDVVAAGSRFLGSGGVASWAKPELVLDLKADTVDLGRAIPESVGVQPAEPRYGHGPLTPLPGKPVMGRRLCKNNNNHPNNIFIDAIKPNGDVCRVCGGALSCRSDDQDETAINKRHDIYYNTTDGTLAAAYFYKDLAGKGKTKYIELNGEGSIDSIKETLLSKLA